MKKFKFYIALIVGRVVAFMVNIIDKEKGSNISRKNRMQIMQRFHNTLQKYKSRKSNNGYRNQWKNNNN